MVALLFVSGWFINPPYGFAPEDNLAYRDYIRLHQRAEEFLEARYPMARVLTAWPASDELTRPYLGYVTRPMQVVRIEHFAAEQLMSAADLHSSGASPDFEVALVFSTKYEPAHPLLEHWRLWQEWKTRFFDYHRDVPPAAAAQILGGNLVYSETRHWPMDQRDRNGTHRGRRKPEVRSRKMEDGRPARHSPSHLQISIVAASARAATGDGELCIPPNGLDEPRRVAGTRRVLLHRRSRHLQRRLRRRRDQAAAVHSRIVDKLPVVVVILVIELANRLRFAGAGHADNGASAKNRAG